MGVPGRTSTFILFVDSREMVVQIKNKMTTLPIPDSLSFLSDTHRIVTVPQDGNCALHVIMSAIPDKAVSVVALRKILSDRITPDNFQIHMRAYAMTSEPRIRKRILACENAEALRAILDHASYYMTNDDLIDIGIVHSFYPIIVNQRYHDPDASSILQDTLLLCDPYNYNEVILCNRFLDGTIPAILFYNRSDIAHYESIQYYNGDSWTNLLMETELNETLRFYIQMSCQIQEQKQQYSMDDNTRYMLDLAALEAHDSILLRRVHSESGEQLHVHTNESRYIINISSRYPIERPSVLRDNVIVDISSFWTTQSTLVELIHPSHSLNERYHMYLDNKKLVRSVLMQVFRTYKLNRPGMAKLRRFVLCMTIAEFETTRHLSPFTDDDDDLVHGMLDMSL